MCQVYTRLPCFGASNKEMEWEATAPCAKRTLNNFRWNLCAQLAEAAASTWLSKEPYLGAAEALLMQQLWPTLLSASLVVSSGSAILGGAAAQPDAAAAAAPFPLFDSCCQREQHGAVCELNVPLPQRLGMPTGSCRFTFAQPAAEPRLQAEARHFAEALQTSIHHQTKNIIEDAWEELVSSMPREAAIALLRDAARLGKPVLPDVQVRAAVRRTASAPLPPLAEDQEDSWLEAVDALVPLRCAHST